MMRIDTVEQWRAVRAEQDPVYLQGRDGPVEVPCVQTMLVRTDLVQANLYNPNHVPADKMELLRQSISDNGFCFPVVAIFDEDLGKFVIIDGFHRSLIAGPDWLGFDYLPLVCLRHDITQRMAATLQFNKARGVHQVDLDAEVIRALIEQGMDDAEVAQRLGMEVDAVHRYKQMTGIAELFKHAAYSQSWEMVEDA